MRPAVAWRRRWDLAPLAFGLALALAMTCTSAPSAAEEPEGEKSTEPYLFWHSPNTPWWISAQLNVIGQYHPAFSAAYSSGYSLQSNAEAKVSVVGTVYGGLRLTPTTEILLDVESAGGRGLSDALGLAGFTNLDVVRNPSLGPAPYIARAVVHQVIPLSNRWIDVERGPLRALNRLPLRRLEVRAGKFSTVDFFDANSVGSDSHSQFMNWTVDNNGAYDYAADTRGYTLGWEAEYQDESWGVRVGEMLMPTVANGIDYDTDIAHARGDSAEIEVRPQWLEGRFAAIRLLGYWNHARMGSYAEAIDAFRAGLDPKPDIVAHRARGRQKLGVGLNLEQELTRALRIFGRWGYSDGRNESFAYTEVDNTVELGLDLRGLAWNRADDKLGFAAVSNGISADHRTYLELGGHGFLLGDGRLNYARELILESYYTARVYNGIYPAIDVQFIDHPGYNRDRGPVWVLSARLHVDL